MFFYPQQTDKSTDELPTIGTLSSIKPNWVKIDKLSTYPALVSVFFCALWNPRAQLVLHRSQSVELLRPLLDTQPTFLHIFFTLWTGQVILLLSLSSIAFRSVWSTPRRRRWSLILSGRWAQTDTVQRSGRRHHGRRVSIRRRLPSRCIKWGSTAIWLEAKRDIRQSDIIPRIILSEAQRTAGGAKRWGGWFWAVEVLGFEDKDFFVTFVFSVRQRVYVFFEPESVFIWNNILTVKWVLIKLFLGCLCFHCLN